LVSQVGDDEGNGMEQSILIQRYDGCVSIMQNGSDVIVTDEHLAEFIRAFRDVSKESPK
jgi:hypothetical protein